MTTTIPPDATGDIYRQLRGDEIRVAEDFVELIDYLSRIEAGISRGDWFYTRSKLPDLIRAADNLREVLSTSDGTEFEAPDARPPFVMVAIRQWAQRYRLGRAIWHPTRRPLRHVPEPDQG
ncbi:MULTISPECIES: hypothetical protein [unclassified Crossiella]|uniref:hypothetical protein n=1 Tax=unclassified Crossiella TaxID=2620835 RepID=UPI001FFED97D|nr:MULTISPECIES: hypothetical protein [unclassified Crossiella]MCK2243685.1 hypothetical protein [Crossiella sp. S99.2]MCK2257544.1 hypothetical protein [Crossiella sp. S99.1]